MERNKAIKFFKVALNMASTFSKDTSTKVGAIAIDPNTLQIISVGYNGLPRKLEETSERWKKPNKYFYVVHAEANMVCNASLNGVSLENSILIVTFYPCNECAKLIIQSGIKIIITKKPDENKKNWIESFKISQELFKELNIEVIYIDDNELID